jgi:C-terminal processing protease CtpA/Prc
VSAGENFMMMVKDYPNVLVVGDRTSGVHSDTLDKTLPNAGRSAYRMSLRGP